MSYREAVRLQGMEVARIVIGNSVYSLHEQERILDAIDAIRDEMTEDTLEGFIEASNKVRTHHAYFEYIGHFLLALQYGVLRRQGEFILANNIYAAAKLVQ